jgi:cell fate regulator YaaT (PSP1 superfamily)
MPQVVGIRFKKACKIYYFSPGDVQDLKAGDQVVVETSRGYEVGRVTLPLHEVSEGEVAGASLKPVIRLATAEDLILREKYATREAVVLQRCRQKVVEYNLPMKVVGAEYNFDGSSLVFFFTSEKRVDFRDLVRDLARLFRARIELRQIGVRDEAKLIGGVGPCGRPLCCISHLAEFEPVSIRMAKQQGLPLSPMEISGLCGRLLCCLAYEDGYYQEAKKSLPKVGEIIDTIHGKGRVLNVNVIKQSLSVELESGMIVESPCAQEEVRADTESVLPSTPKSQRHPPRRRTQETEDEPVGDNAPDKRPWRDRSRPRR